MSSSTPQAASESPMVIADSHTPSSITTAVSRNHQRQQQLPASPILSDPARQDVGRLPAATIDMAVDEDHRTSSSLGRSTIAFCACGSEFGQFYNSWSKVTGSYYLPCMVGSYSCSGLHRKLKPKPASNDSALADCFIQPLACNQCGDTLGIVCTSAPESKKKYAERDFFKLPKIELKSDVTGQIVEAIIEGGQSDAANYQEQSALSGPANMEPPLEKPTAPTHKYSATQMPNHTLASQHRPETSEDVRRFEAMASQPMAPHASKQAQKPMLHEREPAAQNRHNERGGSFASPVNGHIHIKGHPGSPRNGYPSNIAVKLEAIDRLQTQVNLNRATLESCTRDIARVESNLIRLQASCSDHFEGLRREIIQSRLNPQPLPVQQGDRMDDEAFAVFSNALSNVQTKVNEVDNLRLQMVDIKRRIKRLEEVPTNAPAAQPPPTDRAPYSTGARESSIHHTPAAQTAINPNVSHMTPPSRPEARPHGNLRGHLQPQTPDLVHSLQARHAESASGGWVSVNHGTKRELSSGVDGRSDAEESPVGSPKRPKLAPLEPRHQYEVAHEPVPARFDLMDSDEPTKSQTQRQAPGIPNLYPDSTNPSTFIPYTNQFNSEESWRSESQRVGTSAQVLAKVRTHSSPRGRPRGRGRGGRPRKSVINDREMIPRKITPEWEKESWTGAQAGADGLYYTGGDRGALLRRGSGGGQAQSIQASSPQSSMGDPYGHAKKTRTKPIRNSDGVLIRKDGRPDMRSQSSAANLRKVHARKEEEKRAEPGSGVSPTSAIGTRVTSPDSQNSGEQERTNYALSRMFPHGVEEHRVLTSSEHYFVSAGHNHGQSKLPVTRAQSEGSAETGAETDASTREPSHLHEQPSQKMPLDHEQVEHHVEPSVEVDRDDAMEGRPREPHSERSMTSHPAAPAFAKPSTVSASIKSVEPTEVVSSASAPGSSTPQLNGKAEPAAITASSTNSTQSTTALNSSTFQPTNTLQSTSTVHADNALQASSASSQTHGTLSASGPGTAGLAA